MKKNFSLIFQIYKREIFCKLNLNERKEISTNIFLPFLY